MKNKRIIESLIGLLVAVITIIILFYTTIFFLGSEKDYANAISKSSLSFIFNRVLVNLVVSILLLSFFIVFVYLHNRLTPQTGKYSVKKLAKIYIVFASTVSVIFVLLFHVILL